MIKQLKELKIINQAFKQTLPIKENATNTGLHIESLPMTPIPDYTPDDDSGISLVDWYNLIGQIASSNYLGVTISTGGGGGGGSSSGSNASSSLSPSLYQPPSTFKGTDPNFKKGQTPYSSSISISNDITTGFLFNMSYTLNPDGTVRSVGDPVVSTWGFNPLVTLINFSFQSQVSGSIITWAGSGTESFNIGVYGLSVSLGTQSMNVRVSDDTSNGTYTAIIR